MSISVQTYIPVLKWKQGEYQALMRLDEATKDSINPLFIVPPVGFDFEEGRLKHTFDEHLEPFGRRLYAKWGDRPSLIDIADELENAVLANGQNAISSIFADLRDNNTFATPVVSLSRGTSYLKSVQEITARDHRGAAARIKLEDLMNPSFATKLSDLIASIMLPTSDVDLIIDLGAPLNFEPYEEFSAALIAVIGQIEGLNNYRSLSLVSTSFPTNLMRQVEAPGQDIPRHEWAFYRLLLDKLPASVRAPAFGDYTVERPEFTQIDMRLVKPFGKLVYTHNDYWHVRKGPNVRDNGFSQYVEHSKFISNADFFRGAEFSAGDKYIADCASEFVSTGNLTTWKWVSVNHHMTQVVTALSNFHGP